MNKINCWIVVCFILLFIITGSCATPPSPKLEGVKGSTCIQGRVLYQSPIDASPVPYPSATVSAWKKDADRALSEAQTDQNGSYCIEIPLVDYRVELRVW